jgi:hypothetical protein
MATYTSRVVHTPGLGDVTSRKRVFAFIYQKSTGSVYIASGVREGTWPERRVILHYSSQRSRTIYRAFYREIESQYGSYELTLDLTGWPDGNYVIETRELTTDEFLTQTESPPLETLEISVEGEAVQEGDLSLTIDTSPGLSLVAYIKRDRDGRYYKSIDGASEFSAIDLQRAPQDERRPFQQTFILEDGSTTSYKLDRLLTDFEDGSYTLTVYSVGEGGVELRAGLPYNFHSLDGRLERGVLFGTIGLSHDTGSPGALRYLADNGAPISGATVYVIPTDDYTPGVYANSVGTTLTDTAGNWVNSIPAQADTRYTIVFHLPGRYGPDVVEISV